MNREIIQTLGNSALDPTWEEIYRGGRHLNRYPWDAVVSFVYRHRPRNKQPFETDIVEVGCGSAPNLWFAAREGFRVAGIDGSKAAIAYARDRFRSEGLAGDLRVGDFSTLPWSDASFDLAIDRAAITHVGRSVAARVFHEVSRVLRPAGRFYCNVFSNRHSSCLSGRSGPDGLTLDAKDGTLKGVRTCFYNEEQLINQLSASIWSILSINHLLLEDAVTKTVHAEWRLIAVRR